jgi:flagellar basal body rod protein FlgG
MFPVSVKLLPDNPSVEPPWHSHCLARPENGAASLAAFEKWQEAISQNISQGSIPGYKKTDMAFSAIESDLTSIEDGTSSADRVQGSMPAASARISLSQGQLSHTDSDLDFAIQGKGFFKVQQQNGDFAYTRDGQFHVNAQKNLVNSQGMPVMGVTGPITFNEGGGPYAITSDGMITQQGQQVAQLPAYSFSDPSKLRRAGGGFLTPSDPSVIPQKIASPQILNNFLEDSNVSSLKEMVNLVSVSRAYEASQKVIQTADDNADKAIQTLGNTSNS